ncbi:LytR/AlgR family response regulator transcription factor [Spongiimicrobium salis]|uniref:LytR/AlgR family response regulator transcription factor n=1 Tax=Spongiimicrobium salis TaxID=1667022 RepID=UPI00374DCCE0
MENQLKCLIIEDDPAAAGLAQDIIQQHFPQITLLEHLTSIKDGAAQLPLLQPDFVILDINLADGNAFSLLKNLSSIDFKIVFTTSFDTYAVEAFKFSALDYLLKPYTPNELIAAVQKVILETQKENYQEQLQVFFHNFNASTQEKKMVLKNLEATHIVNINDILYVQSDNNYSSFHIMDGRKIMVSKTLKSFEDKLGKHQFFRIHQSYLINLNHIQSFDKKNDTVQCIQGASLPVSHSRKKILSDFLDALF